MFMNDVQKKDEIRNIASEDLRKLGVKCRPKKMKQVTSKSGSKVFKVALSVLPTQTVTLKTGQQTVVPKIIHQLCSFILTKVDTEGLFRKEGSKARQNEIKIALDAGCSLEEDHHVIDVAVVLKTFFREMPEPLIPYGYHEIFLRCILLDKSRVDAILLACLLLPIEHLNTLSYLMQFFHEVADHAKSNKMTAYNLAVVIGPTLFPCDAKLSPNPTLRVTKTVELFKILIENAGVIGALPESVINRIGKTNELSEENADKKKKKRRSGSLTRMFNGLKKIVVGKSGDESPHIVTPDLLLTPLNRSTKKRRLPNSGLSNKKKREVVKHLPDSNLLHTPFTPCRTPVNMNLNGTNEVKANTSTELVKEKKAQWFSRSRSVKNLKQDSNPEKTNPNPKSVLERRWSTVNQIANLKRNKKRNSCAPSFPGPKTGDAHKTTSIPENEATEPDYVRVPKMEYEEFINKVSAIERRISSFELENVQSKEISLRNNAPMHVEIPTINSVQSEYEKTLVQAEPLSPTTDQLAKRLSRDLKIRRSAEQKIIRSPSARKIGSLRRRSRELEKNNCRLSRHQSWHVASRDAVQRTSLKRKPKTGTNVPPPVDGNILEVKDLHSARSFSFGESRPKADPKLSDISCNASGSSSDNWVSAEGFFSSRPPNDSGNSSSSSSRASLAKLRSQNAGMVLAKAKLFDNLKDLDSPGSANVLKPLPRVRLGNKIGSVRSTDARLSYRVKTLKRDDRKLVKKSISPRRRQAYLTQKQKLQLAKHYCTENTSSNSDKENQADGFNSLDRVQVTPLKDCNRIDSQDSKSKNSAPRYATPRMTPQIKRSLNVRSPKRLCRTPVGIERSTPLKVFATPVHNI